MGSHFEHRVFDGKLNKTELQRQYDAYISRALYEYGADAYNGTLTTTRGLEVEDRVFDNEQAAHDYVANNTRKRGAARAVKFKDIRTEVVKEPTFNGKPQSQSFGLTIGDIALRSVNNVYTGGGQSQLFAADQLPEAHKAKAITLYRDYHNKASSFGGIKQQISVLLANKFQDAKSELPTTADYAELKRLVKLRKRAWGALEKAAVKMKEFDIKQAAKLYATKSVDNGLKWLVGGWAAE
jgi:hypothetical protein